MSAGLLKRIYWVASAKADLLEMPEEVIKNFGFALYQVQKGEHPAIGKVLSGFGSAHVIELIQDHKSGTFRALYTVKFKGVIFVLHVFQKKSKKGRETPKQDMELVRARLKRAEEIYGNEMKRG